MNTVKQPAQFYLVLYRDNQIIRWSEYFIVTELKKSFTVLKSPVLTGSSVSVHSSYKLVLN